MSITPPTGILDITDAIVRVSKLEFRGATGFDTILNNVARNTVLLVDQNVEYTTDTPWGLKLPNAWVSEFDAYWASGASGNITFNVYNNTTSGTNGYTIAMDDTTITIAYDGGSALKTVTLGSTLKNDTWRKIHILFERDMLSLAIDGVPVLYFKDTLLRPRVYDEDSGYVIASGLSANRKFKNLRIMNGDKWMTDTTSNIAYVHGNVGIGTTQAAYTLDVKGDIRATGNLLIEGLTTTVDTQNLSIEDAIVEIGRGNDGGTSGKDVGFLFTRNDGTNTTNSNVALIYDESTDRLTLGYSDGSPTDSTLAINTSKSLDVVIPSGNLRVGSTEIALGLNAGLTAQGTQAVAVGNAAGQSSQGFAATAVGDQAGNTSQGIQTTAVGVSAGQTAQGAYATAVGNLAGQTSQGISATALGAVAGATSQGTFALAVGVRAGETAQGAYAVAVGVRAGSNNQGTSATAVGVDAGRYNQDANAVAVGVNAGQTSQGISATALGSSAGRHNQGDSAVAVGRGAGQAAQGDSAVAVGYGAGQTSQGAIATAVGYLAGETSQGISATAVGDGAGQTSQGDYATALGRNAGRSYQGGHATALGITAGDTSQGSSAVAVGRQAGRFNQGDSATAVGYQAGETSQGANAVAVGTDAGSNNQGEKATAVGFYAGRSNQGSFATAVGDNAGRSNQGISAVAVGNLAGRYNQSDYGVAVGYAAGETSQGANAVAVGDGAGQTSQGASATAVGYLAGQTSQGTYATAVGLQAGSNNQGANAVAVGYQAGSNNQGSSAVAVGVSAALYNQGSYAVAVGRNSAASSQGTQAVAVGYQAGSNNQGTNAVAVGYQAGRSNQGSYAIAVGYAAGSNNQHANSIVLNATEAALNTAQASSFYVKPVRGGNFAASALAYTSAGEVVEETNVHFDASGNVGIGTASPTEALHVYSNGTDPTYILATGGTSQRSGIAFAEDPSNTKYAIIEYDGTELGAGNYIAFYSGNPGWSAKGNGLNFLPYNGRVGIGTTSPGSKLHLYHGSLHITQSSDSDGFINIYRHDTSGGPALNFRNPDGTIAGWFGYGSSSINDIRMVSKDSANVSFWTSDTRRMTINGSGNVGIGTASPAGMLHIHQSGTDGGGTFELDGQDNCAITVQKTNAANRWMQGINGVNNYLFWYDADGAGNATCKAFFDFDGSDNVDQNFTGQHRTFIKDIPYTRAEELEGLIVSADNNKYIKMSGGIEAGSNAITTNESLPLVSLSTTSNDKKCFGVISASEDPEKTRENRLGNIVSVSKKELGDTRIYINSVGEGAMWVVNTAGSLESGDYITTSNVAGYGQKQDSEFLANYTVAKITMDCDFEPATQPIQIIKKELANVNYWVKTTYSNVTQEEYSNLVDENRTTTTETVYVNEDGETFTEQDEQSTYTELTQTIYQRITREESKTEQEGYEVEVRQELVNVLDEHGQLQWEDTDQSEKAYKIRYLDASGAITDEANAVHIAAFVGCTYHCG